MLTYGTKQAKPKVPERNQSPLQWGKRSCTQVCRFPLDEIPLKHGCQHRLWKYTTGARTVKLFPQATEGEHHGGN